MIKTLSIITLVLSSFVLGKISEQPHLSQNDTILIVINMIIILYNYYILGIKD